MSGKETLAPEVKFEIPEVSEIEYKQILKALEKEGYTFIVDVLPVSIGQLATDETTSQHFDYFNPSKNVWDRRPVQMEVAINPNKLRIKKSNSKSTDGQIKMLKKEETALKRKLPKELRDFISMRMQKASVLLQLDFKYQQEKGEVLFTNWSGRTDDPIDDQTVLVSTSNVGRSNPTDRLFVGAWIRGDSYDRLFALPVVVLPRKLTV